jgi:DNA (cytosine-5)-methyltransferase 1
MTAYYNEIDPFAASWLRELIKMGVIARGDVDERSIEDVFPKDLEGYTQCHFFAGIGVWSYALRQAGWSDNRRVWTGSCPCQPFSTAGKRKGTSDERHLWPSYYHLISQCKPDVIFGEQVASKDGLAWLDTVLSDLEGADYSVRAADICAAGFGAPHIRQRLYFVADPRSSESRWISDIQRQEISSLRVTGETNILADTEQCGRHDRRRLHRGRDQEGSGRKETVRSQPRFQTEGSSVVDNLGNSNNKRPQGRKLFGTIEAGNGSSECIVGSAGPTNGFWSSCDWLPCIDGKMRSVESGTFPLAYGATNRVGRLRGYGNAVVAPQAQAFIEAYLETKS